MHEIPPETVEQRRRFHRFIPRDARHQLEAATGEDIDGDGHVGASPAGAPEHQQQRSRHVPAPGTSGSPFVRGGGTGRTRPLVVGALALAAIGAWLATRGG